MRWVLKAPIHSLFIDALMATYPDAMLIQTHRDPLEVVGSLFSLYATLRRPLSDRVDVSDQASSDAAYPSQLIQRAVDYRRAHLELEAQFYDVAFEDFMADQIGTLQRIHDHFGLKFTDEARKAMAGYLENRPREKYGKHDYALEQFGLTEKQLSPQFSDYRDQYRDFL